MTKANASNPSPGANDPAPEGRTLPSQESEGSVPRLPHERDESSDSQPDADHSSGNRAVGEQAHEDTKRGLRDTTRGEQTDETYQRLTGGRKR
ncbi:MAG: hypothetical protein ABW051_00310 [Burkholderiaceae bacterium]